MWWNLIIEMVVIDQFLPPIKMEVSFFNSTNLFLNLGNYIQPIFISGWFVVSQLTLFFIYPLFCCFFSHVKNERVIELAFFIDWMISDFFGEHFVMVVFDEEILILDNPNPKKEGETCSRIKGSQRKMCWIFQRSRCGVHCKIIFRCTTCAFTKV